MTHEPNGRTHPDRFAWSNPAGWEDPEEYWETRCAMLEYLVSNPVKCREYGTQWLTAELFKAKQRLKKAPDVR